MTTKKTIFKLLLLSSILFVSCTKEKTIEVKNIFETINANVIVSSEGNYKAKDGSVSYFGKENSEVFYYEKVNGAKVAGLIQSICFGAENAYIILNDVNQIIVVDKKTFKKKEIIQTGLKNPRYMTIVGDKGYVTNWGDRTNKTDDYLAVLNLTTNKLEATKISLPNGVERILAKNNKLYVSHGLSNNIVSVVDLGANNKVTKITVKDNPDEMFFNKAGQLVVLSEGKTIYDTNWKVIGGTEGAVSFINISDNTVSKELIFQKDNRASLMSYDNGNIYYYQNQKVYSITDDSTTLSTSNGISVGKLYGMSAKEGYLFTVSYAFTKLSKLNVIDVATDKSIYSSAVGLGASKVYFLN